MCFKLQEGQETWHAYLDYIDSLVVDGLLYTVACSIGFLLDETDPTLTQVRFAATNITCNEGCHLFLIGHFSGNTVRGSA